MADLLSKSCGRPAHATGPLIYTKNVADTRGVADARGMGAPLVRMTPRRVGSAGGASQQTIVGTSRRFRITSSLSKAQAIGVVEAARHAKLIGLPFNRHVTLRLERAGIPDRDSVRCIGGFLTRFRDWLRKQGRQTAYAWVRECGPVIGSHVHILLHLPPGLTFRGNRTRRWLEAISGRRYEAGTICTRRISQAAYDQNLSNLVAYLCKGSEPATAEALGLLRHKHGGRIMGKRAGWSENVGAKAQHLWRLTCAAS